jgi:hypothetical protein
MITLACNRDGKTVPERPPLSYLAFFSEGIHFLILGFYNPAGEWNPGTK